MNMDMSLLNAESSKAFKAYLIKNHAMWKSLLDKQEIRTGKFIFVELFVDYPSYVIGNLVAANYLRLQYGTRVIAMITGKNRTKNQLLAQSFCADAIMPLQPAPPGMKANIDFQELAALPPSALRKKILSLEAKGILIGDLIYDTYLRSTGLGSIERFDGDLKREINTGFWLAQFFETVFSKCLPLAVSIGHVVFTSYGVMARAAIKHGGEVFCRKPGAGPIAVRKYSNLIEIKSEELTFNEDEVNFIRRRRGPEAEAFGRDFIERRYRGKGEYLNTMRTAAFKGKKALSRDEMIAALGLNAEKPTVCIMSHVMCDAPHVWPWLLHDDYKQWLIETLEIARDCAGTNWIVKPHPDCPNYPEVDTAQKIAAPYMEACDHIKLLPPDISSASLPGLIKAVVTAAGSAGMEFAALGCPVVTCTDNNYSLLLLTATPRTNDEYRKILSTINTLPPPAKDAVSKARALFFMWAKACTVPCSFIPDMPENIWAEWDEETVWGDALSRVIKNKIHDDPFFINFKRQMDEGWPHTMNFHVLD